MSLVSTAINSSQTIFVFINIKFNDVPFFCVFLVDGPPLTTKEVRVLTILRELPFLVAFHERTKVFQSLVYRDKIEHQGEEVQFLMGRTINLSVRRSHLYEDAFDKLSPDNGNNDSYMVKC